MLPYATVSVNCREPLKKAQSMTHKYHDGRFTIDMSDLDSSGIMRAVFTDPLPADPHRGAAAIAKLTAKDGQTLQDLERRVRQDYSARCAFDSETPAVVYTLDARRTETDLAFDFGDWLAVVTTFDNDTYIYEDIS